MPHSQKSTFGNKKRFLIITVVIAFVLGVLAASIFWLLRNNAVINSISQQIKPVRQNNNGYTYINPLLGYDVPGDVKEFNKYTPLINAVNNGIKKVNNPSLQSFSFYFRDLTLGRWAGVNENASYAPGSMMKVAIMVTYFKEAEDNPSILQKTFQYSSSTVDQINGVPFSSASDLAVGKSYTVEQLIEAMIINSDNGAKDVLLDNVNQSSFIEVHTDLGLPNPADSQNYAISPKQYSILLRVLYNATYLSRQYSEKALQIMSKATYNQGLVAGVPQGTAVAQKFGEAIDNSDPNNSAIALSNCGIIYYPNHPYILCIMTKGSDITALTKTISNISQIVWNQVKLYSGS